MTYTYKSLFIYSTLWNFINVLALFIYYTVVSQNLVFTSTHLPVSDVPYYSAEISSTATNRYHYLWWEYATDTLRILPPLLTYTALLSCILYKFKEIMLFVAILMVIEIVEISKLIKRSVDWMECGRQQVCRNFNPTSLASDANYVFITSWVIQVFIVISIPIYLFIIRELSATAVSSVSQQFTNEEYPITKPKKSKVHPQAMTSSKQEKCLVVIKARTLKFFHNYPNGINAISVSTSASENFYQNPTIRKYCTSTYHFYDGVSSKFIESLYECKKETKEVEMICKSLSSGVIEIFTLQGDNIISLVKKQLEFIKNCLNQDGINEYFIHGSDSAESGEREVKLVNLLE